MVVQTSLQMVQLARSLGFEIPMFAREYDVIDVEPPRPPLTEEDSDDDLC